jgi:HSP20 family protein
MVKVNKEKEAARTTERGNGHREQGTLATRGTSTPAPGWTEPLPMMRRFAEEMENLFENFGFGRGLWGPWWGLGRGHTPARRAAFEAAPWSPQVEVFQRGDNLVIRADLPGLTKDDIHVDVIDGALTIQGERRQEHEEKREGYFHSERSYGSFFRRIPLPEGAQADQAEASFREGVLEVALPAPRREAERGKRIEVKG